MTILLFIIAGLIGYSAIVVFFLSSQLIWKKNGHIHFWTTLALYEAVLAYYIFIN